MLKKQLTRLHSGLCIAGLAILLTGCGGSSSTTPDFSVSTVYGTPIPVGAGTARSYVSLKGTVPVAVGIEMTATALTGLPTVPFNNDHVYTFDAPPQLASTAIQGITMDFTDGHVPVGQGDVPHFHPSFFLISDPQRQQITADSPIADIPVAPQFVPANHIPLHMVVPTEGAVYFDPILPGYREMPFSTTNYNYNFFNGNMVLIQTGVTLAYLNSKQEILATLETPQQYPAPGYYPTAYHVKYDSNRQVYQLSVEGFVQR